MTLPNIFIGQIKWRKTDARRDYFVIFGEKERFRAYPRQFRNLPEIGSIVSFIPGPKARSGALRSIEQILFQPTEAASAD